MWKVAHPYKSIQFCICPAKKLLGPFGIFQLIVLLGWPQLDSFGSHCSSALFSDSAGSCFHGKNSDCHLSSTNQSDTVRNWLMNTVEHLVAKVLYISHNSLMESKTAKRRVKIRLTVAGGLNIDQNECQYYSLSTWCEAALPNHVFHS